MERVFGELRVDGVLRSSADRRMCRDFSCGTLGTGKGEQRRQEDRMADNGTPEPTVPDTIVLVHGFWVTPLSWERWIERYEDKATVCSPRPTRALRARLRR